MTTSESRRARAASIACSCSGRSDSYPHVRRKTARTRGSDTGRDYRASGQEVRSAKCEGRSSNFELRTSNFQLRTSNFEILNSGSLPVGLSRQELGRKDTSDLCLAEN